MAKVYSVQRGVGITDEHNMQTMELAQIHHAQPTSLNFSLNQVWAVASIGKTRICIATEQ